MAGSKGGDRGARLDPLGALVRPSPGAGVRRCRGFVRRPSRRSTERRQRVSDGGRWRRAGDRSARLRVRSARSGRGRIRHRWPRRRPFARSVPGFDRPHAWQSRAQRPPCRSRRTHRPRHPPIQRAVVSRVSRAVPSSPCARASSTTAARTASCTRGSSGEGTTSPGSARAAMAPRISGVIARLRVSSAPKTAPEMRGRC